MVNVGAVFSTVMQFVLVIITESESVAVAVQMMVFDVGIGRRYRIGVAHPPHWLPRSTHM